MRLVLPPAKVVESPDACRPGDAGARLLFFPVGPCRRTRRVAAQAPALHGTRAYGCLHARDRSPPPHLERGEERAELGLVGQR